MAEQTRGYHARACGFDLDRDGIIGEPEDCNICDGHTTFPDRDLIYVDCQNGKNETSCGTPSNPCQSIQYAWTPSNTNIGDGNSDGRGDVICFTGICAEENIQPGSSGMNSTYTVPKKGSQVRDWRFPKNPTMLVGWDKDNDGSYPPVDDDDVSILDGDSFPNNSVTNFSDSYAIDNSKKRGYIEYAHFTARGYGKGRKARYSPGHDAGFIKWGGVNQYLHDLHLEDILKDASHDSHHHIFNSFSNPRSYLAAINIKITNAGGYLARGGVAGSAKFRFQNISYTAHPMDMCSTTTRQTCYNPGKERWETKTIESCDFSYECSNRVMEAGSSTISKFWDYSEIEWIDNIFDANIYAANGTRNYQPNPTAGNLGISIHRNVEDVTIRNNEFIDYRNPIHIKYDSENIVIDRNVFTNRHNWGKDHFFVDTKSIDQSDQEPELPSRNILVTNNVFIEKSSKGARFFENNQHSCGVDLVHNTFIGPSEKSTPIVGGNCSGDKLNFKNNIVDISGLSTAVSGEVSKSHNVYTRSGVWSNEFNSKTCSRSDLRFATPSSTEYRLGDSESCAVDSGVPLMSSLVTTLVDLDGERRSSVSVDIGADQLSNARSVPEPGECNSCDCMGADYCGSGFYCNKSTGNCQEETQNESDADGDGIPDDQDECKNDASNTCNDNNPCTGSCELSDADNDGLNDAVDLCPDDPRNTCFGSVARDRTTNKNIRINANLSNDSCAGRRTDCSGDVWEAEFGHTVNNSSYACTGDYCSVGGVPDLFGCSDWATQDLFQCGHIRYDGGAELGYHFDLPNGEYIVNLFFASTYYGTRNVGDVVFDIYVEGQLEYDDFDQVATAGGHRRAVVRSIQAEVSDNSGLEIELVRQIGNPNLRAIEVLKKY